VREKPKCPHCRRDLIHYVQEYSRKEIDYCYNKSCWPECESCERGQMVFVPNDDGRLVCYSCQRAAEEEERRLNRTGTWSDSKSPNCGICGRRMTESRNSNGVYKVQCWTKACRKRRERAEKQARRDEARIAASETDFAAYTGALIDLQAKRARESIRKR
jgi:hypothetical protein